MRPNKTETLWQLSTHLKGNYKYNQEDLMKEARDMLDIICPDDIGIVDYNTTTNICVVFEGYGCTEEMPYKCFSKCLKLRRK